MKENESDWRTAKLKIIECLERRCFSAEGDLQNIKEVQPYVDNGLFGVLMRELIDDKSIMFLECVNEDKPNRVHTIYFSNGTVVYEPGLSVKEYMLSDSQLSFYSILLKRGALEEDVFVSMSVKDQTTYYHAILAEFKNKAVNLKTIDKATLNSILSGLIQESKVTINGNYDMWTPQGGEAA